MKNRKKAQDVFNESNPIFAKKVGFDEAFPQIKDLTIEVSEGSLGRGRSRAMVYHKDIGEYINCSNPMCYNGGFSIGKVLRNMVAKKETEFSDTEICKGYEGSPKGRKRYRTCVTMFDYKVTIEYDDTFEDSTGD